MLKNFFVLTMLLIIITAPAYAMRLELYPQPVGKISLAANGCFQIEGAKKITGKKIDNNTYSKGIALFGDKNFPRSPEDLEHYSAAADTFNAGKLYFHFDTEKKFANFGDRNVKNSVAVDMFRGEREIFVIHNTAGNNFFMLKNDIGTGDGIKIIGLKDGKWIEHLDALALRQKFNIGWNFHMSKVFTEDNKIIFRYTLNVHTIDVICHWHGGNQTFYTEAIEQ